MQKLSLKKSRRLLNNKSIVNNNKIDVKKGDILNFGKALKGFRVYLAISGGFSVNSILNSSSFYENLTPNITVEKGDKFNFLKRLKKNSNSKFSFRILGVFSCKQDRPVGRIISAGPSAIKSVVQHKHSCAEPELRPLLPV